MQPLIGRPAARSATAPCGPSVAPVATIDRAALVSFQRGEPGGVRALYREYGRLVYGVAHRVLGHHELAEEAAQQTFVHAWQAADRLDVERDPASWLATIARRAAIDVYRREARRPARSLSEVTTDDPALVTPAPDVTTLDAVWHVRQAIEELPPDEAAVVRLHHLDGMTHREISDRLGVSVGTVKSRSHRAHRKLAARLRHLRGEHDD